MDNIDLYESQRYYRRSIDFTTRSVDRVLDRFRESLGDWLHGALNWPESDWEADLAGFIEHTRYAGLNIAPESQAMLRALLAARANTTGVFAALADHAGLADNSPIQLAALTVPGQSDTDAEIDYGEDSKEVEEETAGAGPMTSPAFRQKVQLILERLDPFVARIWWQHRGIVHSRERRFLQFALSYYVEGDESQLVITVLSTLTALETALAILELAYASGSNEINGLVLKKKLLTAKEIEKRYSELQTEAFKEAAAQAALLAELYYGAIGSLTPAGELVVTIDDVERNGPRLDHLFILLPLLGVLHTGLKQLVLKLPGKDLRIPRRLLDRLNKLTPARLRQLLNKATAAKTKQEALAIIENGLDATTKAQGHHIATNKNWVSTLRGGPWSPRFESIFDKAGMNLTDVANIVDIPGHRGPHPMEYHEEICLRLSAATKGKRLKAYREALIAELKRIAKEANTAGTKLNRLITK